MTNKVFEKLSLLIQNGQQVLELNERFFIFARFDYSMQSTSTSTDYCRAAGAVEITEFLDPLRLEQNPTAFLQRILKVLETVPPITIEVNKFTTKYVIYRK